MISHWFVYEKKNINIPKETWRPKETEKQTLVYQVDWTYRVFTVQDVVKRYLLSELPSDTARPLSE